MKTSPRRSSSRACIETLEGRTLLSASPVHHARPAPTPSTTTTLHVSKKTAAFGQDVMVNVNVHPKHGKLSGEVEILDNGAPIAVNGTTLELGLRGQHAAYLFGPGDLALAPGAHSLAAEYLGNTVLPASTSAPVTVTVTTTLTRADSVQTTIVKHGHGAVARQGKMAYVLYTGFFADNGKIFDYSRGHGSGSAPYLNWTIEASPEQVIPGFDQGVAGMRVGEERAIYIPSALAYGSTGTTGIPANSDLIFIVRLLAVR